MLEVYRDKKSLDSRCVSQFELSEEILMENAGIGLKNLLEKLTHAGSVVSIVCGGGDNGGDGYVLARQLHGRYKVRVLVAKEPKSPLCIKQYHRALALGVECVKKLLPCDVVVDCLIGSGLKSQLDEVAKKTLAMMQSVGRIKIACDIPSGISSSGEVMEGAFCADYTLAMGGVGLALLSDEAKNCVGKILTAELGVSMSKYALPSQIKLLEEGDLRLPVRQKRDSHKGDFGHLCIYAGERSGAASLAGMAALGFGVGSVSVVGSAQSYFAELMYDAEVSKKTSAFCIGMGMGMGMGSVLPSVFDALPPSLPCVLDADILRLDCIDEILRARENLVLTPHVGEFLALWERCFGVKLDKQELVRNRVDYLLEWSERYPHAAIVLKGANTLIAQKGRVFINPLGNVALAKAGSGDVLAGLIGALLAQGTPPLESALQATLAHSLASKDFEARNYALRPLDLIDRLAGL